MEIISNVSDLRISAIQNRPAFNAAYSQAPSAIRFKGRVLSRDVAQREGVESQLAYLAAVALTAPEELSPVANANTYGFDSADAFGAFGLDPDKSELTAAIAAQREAETALRALESTLKKQETRLPQINREIVRWTGKAADCHVWDGADVGLAILTLGIGTGIKKTVCEQEAKDKLLKLRDEYAKGKEVVEDAKNAIEAAKADVVRYAGEVKRAQEAYDTAALKLRAEEEAARLEKLKREADEARRLQQTAEAEAAETARKAAAEAATARAKQAAEDKAAQNASDAEWAAYCKANPDDVECGGAPQGGFTDASGNAWENNHWLDAEQGEDTYGSAEQSADVGASRDPDSTPHYSSPYDFDRYYGCDCAGSDGDEEAYGCDACDAVYGLDGTAYGADTGQVIGGIIAGVLVAAPAIIGAFTDKPGDTGQGGNSKLGETGEQGKPGVVESAFNTVLKETGFQKTIDNHAKTAGSESAAKLTPILWAVGLGVLGLGAAFLVTRK